MRTCPTWWKTGIPRFSSRLRDLFFRSKTEKTDAVTGRKTRKPTADPPGQTGADAGEGGRDESRGSEATSPSKGHGRNGSEAYRGGSWIDVAARIAHRGRCLSGVRPGNRLRPGSGRTGPDHRTAAAGGEDLSAAKAALSFMWPGLHPRPRPRSGCGERKYDATAGSMIGLLKYGGGLPFHRLDGLQADLGVPLPASTQWDIVQAVAVNIKPVFDELIRQAAQGDLLHNDDTTVKILELMGDQGRLETLAVASEAEDVAESRRGLFTSGVVAVRDGHRVALFFSGRRHAGENLAQVLKHRVESLPPPIQMCDALSRATYRANSRRSLGIAWPMPGGGSLMSTIDFTSPVATFSNRWPWFTTTTPSRGGDNSPPEVRLRFHQEASRPTMQDLHDWLTRRAPDEKRTEPNSALGGASVTCSSTGIG